ncbi:MarR family winged helix-turn-helix transcriptional regulator [Cystobacter fuscus]|nr:MarR family transcriptional regulator [Cystobacter fuscus]
MAARDREAIPEIAALMNQLTTIHRAAAARLLEEVGLTEFASGVLWTLRRSDQGLSMSAVAEQLTCDASNVTLLARQLEQSGVAERVPDPGDGRKRLLRLTPLGRQVSDRLMRVVSDASPLARLTERERAELLALLTRLIQ